MNEVMIIASSSHSLTHSLTSVVPPVDVHVDTKLIAREI